MRPDVIQEYLLGLCIRMHTIGLHQRGDGSDIVHEEGHQGSIHRPSEFGEDALELLDVDRSIVGGETHTRQQNPSPAKLDPFNDLRQVASDHVYGLGAQTIVPAKLENHDLRSVGVERWCDPGQSVRCRVTADAGVDHLMGITALFQSLLQQTYPPLVYTQTKR